MTSKYFAKASKIFQKGTKILHQYNNSSIFCRKHLIVSQTELHPSEHFAALFFVDLGVSQTGLNHH